MKPLIVIIIVFGVLVVVVAQLEAWETYTKEPASIEAMESRISELESRVTETEACIESLCAIWLQQWKTNASLREQARIPLSREELPEPIAYPPSPEVAKQPEMSEDER